MCLKEFWQDWFSTVMGLDFMEALGQLLALLLPQGFSYALIYSHMCIFSIMQWARWSKFCEDLRTASMGESFLGCCGL